MPISFRYFPMNGAGDDSQDDRSGHRHLPPELLPPPGRRLWARLSADPQDSGGDGQEGGGNLNKGGQMMERSGTAIWYDGNMGCEKYWSIDQNGNFDGENDDLNIFKLGVHMLHNVTYVTYSTFSQTSQRAQRKSLQTNIRKSGILPLWAQVECLGDLQGPKFRVGELAADPIELKNGDIVEQIWHVLGATGPTGPTGPLEKTNTGQTSQTRSSHQTKYQFAKFVAHDGKVIIGVDNAQDTRPYC